MCHEGYAEALFTRRRESRENVCDIGAACEAPSLQQRLRAVVVLLRTDAGKQKASAPDGNPTQTSCSAAAAAMTRLAGVRDCNDDCTICLRLRKRVQGAVVGLLLLLLLLVAYLLRSSTCEKFAQSDSSGFLFPGMAFCIENPFRDQKLIGLFAVTWQLGGSNCCCLLLLGYTC